MRELKFRAWNEETKSFVYFDLYEGTECGLTNLQIWAINNPIEQYTGLKDKNGKEIYEGDILKIEAYHCNYSVVYRDFDCCFCGENNGVDNVHLFNSFPHAYEVIGNIHENKELLEEEC